MSIVAQDCRMRTCLRCREWKPLADFPMTNRGNGLWRLKFCYPCWGVRNAERMAYRREYMDKQRRKRGAPTRNTMNRMPQETVREYADHVFGFWPRLPLVKLALSEAPAEMQPAIKREVFAMARAA